MTRVALAAIAFILAACSMKQVCYDRADLAGPDAGDVAPAR